MSGTFDFVAGPDFDDSVEQGATWDQTFEYTDDANNPINLTGYTARMQVRQSIDDTVVLLECTTVNGKIILGGALGTVQILVTATDTAALSWDGQAVYDIELVNGTTVTRFLSGLIELSKEVTR